MMQPTDRVSLQACVDSGQPFLPPDVEIKFDRPIIVNKRAWIPPMQVRAMPGMTDPMFDLRVSKVRMEGVEILCDGHAVHGIVNRSGWDNDTTVINSVTVRNATSHAILHEDGDSMHITNFHPWYCGGGDSFGVYVQNNFLNSRVHFAMTDQCGGVYLSKRDQQPEGVDIGGKIIPYIGRSGVEVHHGLKINIMGDAVIDQCGKYALYVGTPVSDLRVLPGAYLGGMNGPDHQHPAGDPNAPLIVLNNPNMISLDGVTIQGGASDQLLAFPGTRLLDITGCWFQNVAPGRANCNITGMQQSNVIMNRFWHARQGGQYGGNSLYWQGGDASCAAYDNTSFFGNDPAHGGAWGRPMNIAGATRVRDNTNVTLPNGWTH